MKLPRNHYKSSIKYHLIFSTKYRRKCLNGIKDYIFEAFKYAESKSNFKILFMNTDNDHIHFLITCSPNYSVGQIVKRMKQISTFYIWKKCAKYLKQYYWKNKKILWTHGYFVGTIGNVSEKKIEEYILNQGNSNTKLKT